MAQGGLRGENKRLTQLIRVELSDTTCQRRGCYQSEEPGATDTSLSIPYFYGTHGTHTSVDANHLTAAQTGRSRSIYASLSPCLGRLLQVNANIVKPAERAVLTRLVELMIPLGLRFWLEKAENGQPMMRLEP